jgi:hypothetical protein
LSAVLNSGCSFVMIPRTPPESRFGVDVRTCTTNRAAPVVDTMVAGLQVVRIAIAAGASEEDSRQAQLPREADIAIGASLLGLFAASAAVGYAHVNACKEARGEGPGARPSYPLSPAGARRTFVPAARPAPAAPSPDGGATANAPSLESPTLTASPASPDAGAPAVAVPQQADDEEADRPRRGAYDPAESVRGVPPMPTKPGPRR